MKRFIFQTIWAGLLTAASINAILHTPGQSNKIIAAIIIVLTATYYTRAIWKLGRWLKASSEEKEKLKKEWILERRSNFAFWLGIGFLAFLVIGLGQFFEWHPLYITATGLYFLFTIPNAIFKARERRREKKAREAETEINNMKAEEGRKKQLEREENTKKEPQLVGPAEAPPGKIALGWLIEENKETLLRTARLETANQSDRNSHFYIVGASGMGKTKLLESLILQDARHGCGFGVIDPHGDLTEEIKLHLAYGPGIQIGGADRATERARFLMERVVLVDPTDKNTTASFNPLELYEGVPASELSGELLMIFKKIWADSWGPRLEDLLRNSFIALAEAELTLCDLPDFLIDENFRRKTLARVKNETCRTRFRQFEQQSQQAKNQWIEPVLNKINALLTDERLRDLFSAPKSTFNLRDVIDSGKILLVKLDKGRLKGSADLLGSLIVAKIQMAAFARTDIPPEKRRPFYLYIDEFQNFATEHFLETLAEARKYRLHLILAHQNLSQLPERLQAAILTNSGVQIYFRTSHQDAHILARESSEEPAQLSGFDKMIGETNPLHHNKDYELKGQRWADREQLLKDLPPRWCVLKNKSSYDGAVLLKTDRIPNPLEGIDEETAGETRKLTGDMVGAAYLRKRDELARQSREAGEREEPEDPVNFRESKNTKG